MSLQYSDFPHVRRGPWSSATESLFNLKRNLEKTPDRSPCVLGRLATESQLAATWPIATPACPHSTTHPDRTPPKSRCQLGQDAGSSATQHPRPSCGPANPASHGIHQGACPILGSVLKHRHSLARPKSCSFGRLFLISFRGRTCGGWEGSSSSSLGPHSAAGVIYIGVLILL